MLQHEKEKGVALDWGFKIENNKTTHSSLLNRSGEGHTLAHWAAKRGNDIRFMEYLSKITDASLHLPSTDTVGVYPIHWAATEGSIPIVALILKHSNSTSGYATTSSSSTHHHHHHHPQLQNDVKIDPNDPINARDNSNCTPLLIAAQYGHGDLAAFLIKRGADPNAVDNSTDASLRGNVDVVQYLMDQAEGYVERNMR